MSNESVVTARRTSDSFKPGSRRMAQPNNTAQPHMIVATRIIPVEGFLMTGGAGLPVDASAAERISKELKRTGYNPETFDYEQITPRQEAEVARQGRRQDRDASRSRQDRPPGSARRRQGPGFARRQ